MKTLNISHFDLSTELPEHLLPFFARSEAIKQQNATKKVVVGMSGGVDSSVAALLLKFWGYEVIGVFMKNWDETRDDSGECTATEDYEDVVRVAEYLDIPYYTVDFSPEYWENVFMPSIEDFKQGITPNPDVLCNREIKFKVFFEKALALGADYLATGHYCRVDATHSLLKGLDSNKDQTYFLYTVKSSVLSKVLFPVGDIPKPLVREIAHLFGLSTKSKKDSTGICFIGERKFQSFLEQYIEAKPGLFCNLKGEGLGEHRGAMFYTLGQRKGLGLGGPGEPWFVVGKNMDKNIVYVERGTDHPALFSKGLMADTISLVNEKISTLPPQIKIKVRYRQTDQDCEIESFDLAKDNIVLRFKEDQRAVTPGQSVVFYEGDVCLGGAIIRAVLS